MGVRGHLYEQMSDEELARLFTASGEKECFAELFRRHSQKVFQACFAFSRERARAQDATSETFLRAWQSNSQFKEGSYLNWLRRIARNVCIDQWRKQKPEVSIDGTEDEPGIDIAAPATDLSAQSAVQQLREQIARLPAGQKVCVELNIEGYSYEETAIKTGMTIEAVRSHLQNGRRTLRMRLQGVPTA